MHNKSTSSTMLAFSAWVLAGGVLELAGPGSQIEFGHTRATITATCKDALSPYIAFVTPAHILEADRASQTNLTVEFSNLSPTCLDIAAGTPCVAHNVGIRPSFWCKLTGAAGSLVTSGPRERVFVSHP